MIKKKNNSKLVACKLAEVSLTPWFQKIIFHLMWLNELSSIMLTMRFIIHHICWPYLKYSSVHFEKAGIFFAAPLKSTGFPGRTFWSKNSRDDGTKLVLSNTPTGGWWEPKGFRWPGGCSGSWADKTKIKSKINSAFIFLRNKSL